MIYYIDKVRDCNKLVGLNRPGGPPNMLGAQCGLFIFNAGVAELVDAQDLGSCAARRGGSSPSTRTIKLE